MPALVWQPDTPRAILLATDLSGRCDRALDRSVVLAREWDARLVALTVVETARRPGSPGYPLKADQASRDSRLTASKELRSQVAAGGNDIPVEVLVRDGTVGHWIEAVALESGCSLIVTGTARNEPLGRILLGSTVDRLSRTSRRPVLTVRRRTSGPYSRIVVATDFSSSSLRALHATLELLPDLSPTLFHAFHVPFLGLLDTSRDHAVEQVRASAIAEANSFLSDAGEPGLAVVIQHGEPATLLHDYALVSESDLIVVASHGRGALLNLAIGSVAQRIIELAPCDTLLIPEARARQVL